MLCENCGKKEATVHYTKIINGEKSQYHLCEACAGENEELISTTNDFSFHNLLSGLLNFDSVINGGSVGLNPDSERCKACGLTFTQFKKFGKFGCHECYSYFEPQLEPIFRRIHGNSKHSGKVPLRTGSKIKLSKELETLKLELQQKIAKEQFEEAAIIRDKIKSLELKLSERGS